MIKRVWIGFLEGETAALLEPAKNELIKQIHRHCPDPDLSSGVKRLAAARRQFNDIPEQEEVKL